MINANILIIDDSIVVAEFLKNVLEQEGHTVVTTNNGRNFLELIKEYCIDIILLDIVMPEIDGFEVLGILKNSEETREIPVIMITGLTSAMEVKKALDLGAMDFIRKSAEQIEITARINSALKLKHKQDQLLLNAQTDPLTQLYNKQYFNVSFQKLINERTAHPAGIALIVIDCDHFKSINDRFGHTFGDDVLCDVANAIKKSTKRKDIACRFGGEEFIAILPDVTTFQACSVAERIRKNIEKIPYLPPNETTVTVSCGVGHTVGDDNKTSLQVVNEADMALYAAKRNGRNRTVLFDDSVANFSADTA